jgi:hypothetical protein
MRRSPETWTIPPLAAVLLSTVVAVIAPGTAHADPPVTFVPATTVTNSTSPKIAIAQCAPGEQVFGGSAVVTGGHGQVLIQSAFPAGDKFTVKAVEDFTGTADNWSLTAGAYCTSGVAIQYVASSSLLDSNAIKTATIPCPEGKKAVGMGGQVSTARGFPTGTTGDVPPAKVVFKGMEVNENLRVVTARGTEVGAAIGDTYAANWTVTAVVACAAETDVPGLVYWTGSRSTGLLPTDSESRLDISCKKTTISMGATIDDHDLGQWYLDRFSRYNAFQQEHLVTEAYRNPELGSTTTTHSGFMICI